MATPLPDPFAAAPALECLVDGARLALPLQNAGQVIEAEVVPLPLSRPHVQGLALHEGRLLLYIGLAKAPPAGRRRAKAVVLAQAGFPIDLAFEVTRVVGIVRATPEDSPAIGPLWLGRATGADGAAIAWVRVRELADALTRARVAP